jgi:hypothetical protein
LARKVDDGVADVSLLQRYPGLGVSLPLARRPAAGFVGRIAARLAAISPRAGDRFATGARWLLPAYERIGLRFRWRALMEDLLDYWYWRGIVHASGGTEQLSAMLRQAPVSPETELELDLSRGIAETEHRLDELRPRSVRFVYGEHLIGAVRERDGAERLRGVHLREMIARHFAREYLCAAARAGAIPHGLPALPAEILDGSATRHTSPRPAPPSRVS